MSKVWRIIRAALFTRNDRWDWLLSLTILTVLLVTAGEPLLIALLGMAGGNYGVSIGRLPDVARFVRAAASCGIRAPLFYSAGSGWHLGDDDRTGAD